MREWRLSLKSSDTGGVVYINTLAIKVDMIGPDMDEASPTEVCDGCDTWLSTYYRQCLRNSLTLQELQVMQLGVAEPLEGAKTIGSAGMLVDNTGDVLPDGACGILTLKTALATRSGRGRMFIPGPERSAYVTQNVWNPALGYLDAIGALGGRILAGHDLTVGLNQWHISARVWSRVLGESHDVTGYVVRNRIHWLRSRTTAP